MHFAIGTDFLLKKYFKKYNEINICICIDNIKDLSDVNENSPDWYKAGVEAAMLAPTAVLIK